MTLRANEPLNEFLVEQSHANRERCYSGRLLASTFLGEEKQFGAASLILLFMLRTSEFGSSGKLNRKSDFSGDIDSVGIGIGRA